MQKMWCQEEEMITIEIAVIYDIISLRFDESTNNNIGKLDLVFQGTFMSSYLQLVD